jgi:hypothetical protein
MGPRAGLYWLWKWLQSPMPERRSTKRISARLKVWCEGDDFTLLAETINVSPTGLFVRTSSPPPSNEQFKVTIEELTVVAQVEVAWSRAGRDAGRGGMGLHILGFEAGSSEYQHFLDTHRSGEYRATSSPPPRMPDLPEPEDGEPDKEK